MPFVEGSPLTAASPDGYGTEGCEVDVRNIGSIYPEVELYSPELYPDATANGGEPGIEAMRDAIDGMTGLTIQYSALIDMYGFSNLVDTLRGVTMNVPVAVPIHADEGFTTAAEWIQPGIQLMDGYYAPRYARSRHDPTDYDRTQLQQAIVCWWP